MRLRAGCELVFELGKETPLIMMLRPRRDARQRIVEERMRISPAVAVTEHEDGFGNRCQRLTAGAGTLRVSVETLADVAPMAAVDRCAPPTPVAKLPHEVLQHLLPSRYCPSDKLSELAKSLTQDVRPGYAQVQALRDHVHAALDYRYGVSNASTDACETLATGAGVCRDFAHVAIALCRALDIPARMAVGYLHQLDPMDLHAWFEAYVGDRWYTFDACEEQLRGGRIVLAYGRDAADVAFVTDFGALETRSMNVWVRSEPRVRARALAEAAE